jgi:hypothetical protein
MFLPLTLSLWHVEPTSRSFSTSQQGHLASVALGPAPCPPPRPRHIACSTSICVHWEQHPRRHDFAVSVPVDHQSREGAASNVVEEGGRRAGQRASQWEESTRHRWGAGRAAGGTIVRGERFERRKGGRWERGMRTGGPYMAMWHPCHKNHLTKPLNGQKWTFLRVGWCKFLVLQFDSRN